MADLPANSSSATQASAVIALRDDAAGGQNRDGDRASARAPLGPPPAGGSEPPVVDVWSRTQPKYRIRSILLLLLNLLLYCGLCVFTHWLHVARPFDFSLGSYAAPARFWGAGSPNLNDFILYPISVVQVPVHAAVLGLLVAAIVAVPIVIALLYRLPFALPFLAAVLLFAHMPWMALTLMLSCILAVVRPFRLSFRFGSALVAMLPVVLYLYLATRGGTEQYGAASPTHKLLLAAPWVLAILAACVMMGVVLLISRLVDYRPGGVAPVVAVMFATPVILFHARVGVDELEYRVLEAQYGPRSPGFEPVQNAEPRIRGLLSQLATDEALYQRFRDDLLDALHGETTRIQQLVRRSVLTQFLADRRAAYEACRQFIADHPSSPYVPSVLYIQAGVLDTRLDERRLAEREPRRELYTDFPHVQSEATWLKLLRQYPDSPLSIAAALRLAELRLRRGDVDAAMDYLELILSRDPAPTTAPASLLSRPLPEASLGFEPRPYRRAAEHLCELIAANRDDPRYGNEPLQALAGLDPHRRTYLDQLLRLANQYRDGRLYDNLMVRWATALPDAQQRVAMLEACVSRFPAGDALPEALFRLADLEVQALAGQDESRRARGLARLGELVARFGDTCWGRQAAERLTMVGPRPDRPAE